jgi:DHA3 family macrolide efflux protein-like MFS transporter
LFVLILMYSIVDFFTMPAVSFRPLLITSVLGKGAAELGWVNSIAGVGIILGGLLLSVWGGFTSKIKTAALGWLITGIGSIAIGLTPTAAFWIMYAGSLCIGLSLPIGSGPTTALYQKVVPPEMQGRFFALQHSLNNLMVPLGLLTAALVGHLTGVRFWWILTGIGHASLALLMVIVPSIRNMEKSTT